MPTPITRAELTEMVPHLRGEMRAWAEQSSDGEQGTTVYADNEMLKRCRAAQKKKRKGESNKSGKATNDADVQGQPGADVEPIAEPDGGEEASADVGS